MVVLGKTPRQSRTSNPPPRPFGPDLPSAASPELSPPSPPRDSPRVPAPAPCLKRPWQKHDDDDDVREQRLADVTLFGLTHPSAVVYPNFGKKIRKLNLPPAEASLSSTRTPRRFFRGLSLLCFLPRTSCSSPAPSCPGVVSVLSPRLSAPPLPFRELPPRAPPAPFPKQNRPENDGDEVNPLRSHCTNFVYLQLTFH